MTIRAAETKDIPEIVRLLEYLLNIHESLDPDYYNYEENYSEYLKSWVEQQINSQNQFMLVAEANGGNLNRISGIISGYIKYLFPWFKTKSVGHISFLSVDHLQQKRGIGKKLEEAAETWFKKKNIKYIEVFSNEANIPGKAAWKSYGYLPFNKFFRKII